MIEFFFIFFNIFSKASHLLKTVLLKYLCCHFYSEVHFQIQSLLCVGSLLLPDAAPPAVSCVPDSPRNAMRDKNLSHDRVREKCRKELCINPTVWGGLVLFWNHTISLLQIPFFLSLHRHTFRRWCFTATSCDPSSLCYIFSICTLATGQKEEACSGLLSFAFVISFFLSVSLWFVSSSGWL